MPTAFDARAAFIEVLENRLLLSGTQPNDPYLGYQWGLQAIDATAAWAQTAGSPATKVGILDTGVDYTHRDLFENVWLNQAEIPAAVRPKLADVDGDGLISFYDLNAKANAGVVTDNNKNGYIDAGDLLRPVSQGGWEDGINGLTYKGDTHVDDIIGWNFADNNNNPMDLDGHGTHVAGIVGAMGDNGVGVSGVAQKISMMALRIFNADGTSAGASAIAEAIKYAADAGAAVMNASWGGPASTAIHDAIAYAGTKNSVFVTAAGNDAVSDDTSPLRSYPAAYPLANEITVAAATPYGGLSSYSDYGQVSVDLAAPGDQILSTWPGGRYAYLSGTSMATPFVTGAVALMRTRQPTLSVGRVVGRVTAAVNQSPSLYYADASHGELEVGNAINAVGGSRLQVTQYATAATGGGGSHRSHRGWSSLSADDEATPLYEPALPSADDAFLGRRDDLADAFFG